jgi:hypothetical protein
VTRLLSAFLISLSLLYATACGNIFVGGALGTASTFEGTVSLVQLSDVNGNVQVTFVTFLQSGSPFTIGFCGDQTSRFPLTQTVRVNFNPGQTCATVVVVVIVV